MDDPKVCLVCPTYGHFAYALTAVRTFLANTPDAAVVLVDDASPDWDEGLWRMMRGPRFSYFRFTKRNGCTRSWNMGLRMARDMRAGVTVVGNSDLLFPAGWFRAVGEVLAARPLALAGPVTNAPGHRPRQAAGLYWPAPKKTDDEVYLAKLSAGLYGKHKAGTRPGPINGFCMAARTDTWWKFAFDKKNVFNPDPRFRMTRNEDELIGRWTRGGGEAVVVPGSFVLHFRGVSRGKAAITGREGAGWFRRKGAV